MFLQQVYKHSKWLFIVMVTFIIAQLFINYKHGMVASPFFHFGMYSDVLKVKKSYGVFEVKMDGKMLQGKDYSPQQWDKILLPLQYFAKLNKVSNQLYHTDIRRLMEAAHVSNLSKNNALPGDSKYYLQHCNEAGFINWYKQYLPGVINQAVTDVDVSYRMYVYDGNSIQPTDTMLTLAALCR